MGVFPWPLPHKLLGRAFGRSALEAEIAIRFEPMTPGSATFGFLPPHAAAHGQRDSHGLSSRDACRHDSVRFIILLLLQTLGITRILSIHYNALGFDHL